ncbi:MAG: Gfo/Idh/MocA family oxidoreductase [Bryobacterales bacterium]|nr:Gfo/Idh/MocA family oxidoreductase [Bryobacterales bacterium]
MQTEGTAGRVSRRDSLKAVAGAFMILPAGSARTYAANEKLNMGMIGLAGMGAVDLGFFSGRLVSAQGFAPPGYLNRASENIVALCDVDATYLESRGSAFPQAKRYTDFRKMIESEKLDAVSIAVPDHMHCYISVWAMKHGLNVYCQKPLCQTVHEARVMARVAAETKVVTQMGTQMSSMPSNMRLVELIQSGVLGEITEIHMATDRPIWPQGFNRPPGEEAVPKNLDWDLWQGTAPTRPFLAMYPKGHPVYNPLPEKKHQLDFKDAALEPVPPVGVVYHPFVWRGWTEYGTGVIGDSLGHSWFPVVWALDLGPLSAAEVVEDSGMTKEQFPDWSVVRYEWAGRGVHPPLKIYHYDGGKRIPKEVAGSARGSIWIGTKGSLPQGAGPFQGQKMDPYPVPPQKDWDREEVHKDFTTAIRTGKLPPCHFGVAGPYAESYLLGNVALRVGHRIEWDPLAFRITNCREANQHLFREYRKGWDLKEIAGAAAYNV